MKSNKVDVLIYMQANNKPELVSKIATNIGTLTGVIKASINPKLNHLLAVEYDPDHVSGDAILNVARQSDCTASLVGM